MGATCELACLTCRKRFYLGYSSYGHHPVLKEKFPAAEHEGHEVVNGYNEDHLGFNASGDLVFDHDDSVYIKDFAGFEKIDLSEDDDD